MTELEQIEEFSDKLDDFVDQFRHEWDLCHASMCGVLLMKIRLLQDEAIEAGYDDNDGDEKVHP